MKEYTLIIKGEMDFIILSPQVLSSLITQIHNSPERKVVVSIESIMPPKFSNERFRYRYILENPVTKKGMYEILRQQLSRTNTERFPCFQTIQLTDTFQGNVELDMECNDLFFWACKDTAAKFVYTFPDGREETLVIEY